MNLVNNLFFTNINFCKLKSIQGLDLKVVSTTFLLVCFLRLKESTRETRENVLFHFESFFRS